MAASVTQPVSTTQQIMAFMDLVAEPLEQVKESLLASVPKDSEVLAKTVEQSLISGGKYLRPIITLLMGASTGQSQHAHIEVAAVTEMIHVATLLHDDVLDESDLRRGKRTVRASLGNKISVLSGDYLLAHASLKLSKLDNCRLVAIFSHVLADLCDGEIEQLQTSYNLNASWDSYFKKTIGKTASLFSAGCESAGVINQLPEERIQALKTYGRNFGIAFQIMDDLLDYTGDAAEMGKPVLDDLRNGLLNAPILLALESESDNQAFRTELEGMFQAAQQSLPVDEFVGRIQTHLEQTGMLDKTRQMAHDYIESACRQLDFLPESREKEALLAIAEYAIQRRK